jgi:hypothetical protein
MVGLLNHRKAINTLFDLDLNIQRRRVLGKKGRRGRETEDDLEIEKKTDK